MATIAERLSDTKRVRGFIITYYVIGFAGMVFPLSRPFFEQLTGLTIFISFLLMMLFHQGWTFRFIFASLLIFAGGFFIEVTGVQTSAVFGSYVYLTALGPKWFGTPLMLGVNWLMLIYAVHYLLLKARISELAKPFIGAAMLVVYDILLEPVAINWKLWQWQGGSVNWNLWQWTQGSVPVKNYLAWFVISLLFLLLMNVMKVKYVNRISTLILIAQVCLFLVLNIVLVISQ